MKQYRVDPHAVKRAIERLGIAERHAANHLRQLMQTAYYVGDKTSRYGGIRGKVFDNVKARVRIIVIEDDLIKTVYKMADPLAPIEGNPIVSTPPITDLPDELKAVLKRKSDALIVRRNRELRSLTIQLAEKNLELAQLELNRARARAHKIIAVIDAKIDIAKKEYATINEKVDAIKSEIKSIEKGVAAYV
ncbi:hypothetical protein MOB18_21250 [Bacillus inaquosorum]|uniref:hypothetical protein n=1 Tax=Bacillus inaquosorum TaxID=483913 RepID=UPI00227EB726|nr:hypothetical protein [Bacillus inaquosorum]MCY7751590.1 hypothetical protein [Bacillus inaquosorum]